MSRRSPSQLAILLAPLLLLPASAEALVGAISFDGTMRTKFPKCGKAKEALTVPLAFVTDSAWVGTFGGSLSGSYVSSGRKEAKQTLTLDAASQTTLRGEIEARVATLCDPPSSVSGIEVKRFKVVLKRQGTEAVVKLVVRITSDTSRKRGILKFRGRGAVGPLPTSTTSSTSTSTTSQPTSSTSSTTMPMLTTSTVMSTTTTIPTSTTSTVMSTTTTVPTSTTNTTLPPPTTTTFIPTSTTIPAPTTTTLPTSCTGLPNGAPCADDGNPCTMDVCQSGECTHPAGNGGTVCRFPEGGCDVAEVCSGLSDVCPTDLWRSAGFVCRPSAGFCDVEEQCDGLDKACPTDAFLPDTTECREVGQEEPGGEVVAADCDVAEFCTGTDPDCPANAFLGAEAVCRAAAGDCDVEEVCSGTKAQCPGDVKEASGVVCRESVGFCDVAETCDGANDDCPTDATRSDTSVCRMSQGGCDVTETCGTEGTNPNWPNCPDDGLEPEGTVCEDPLTGAYGECFGDKAACPLLNCKYTIDCPNGYECMVSPPGGIARGACLPETNGSFGSSCTGTASPGQGTCNSGLNCCRGMRFDGEGVAAGNGESGRCMECCLTDALDETVVGCGGPPFQCCDGRCIDPDSSERHCGACAYNSAGRDCLELVSACNPSAECDLGACKYDEPCFPEACVMPTGDPDCTDLACYARPIDECFDGPSYTGCDWSCGGTIEGDCLHEPCVEDADCCTGTVCTSSCNPLTNPYCVDPLTCEPAE